MTQSPQTLEPHEITTAAWHAYLRLDHLKQHIGAAHGSIAADDIQLIDVVPLEKGEGLLQVTASTRTQDGAALVVDGRNDVGC